MTTLEVLRSWVKKLTAFFLRTTRPPPLQVVLDPPAKANGYREPAAAAVAAEPEPEPEPEKKHRGPYTYGLLRRDLAASVLEILERVGRVDPYGTRADRYRHDNILLHEILDNDFLVIDADLIDRMKAGSKYGPDDMEEDAAELAEASWPIDAGFVSVERDDEDEEDRPLVCIYRVMTVDPGDVRGQVRMVTKKMVRIVRVIMSLDEKPWVASDYHFGLVNHRWVRLDINVQMKHFSGATAPLGARFSLPKKQATFAHDFIALASQRTFARRYNWHVAFGAGDQTGFRTLLPTNPEDCLKLFKDREVTEGMSRRSALKHWVEKHLRDTSGAGTAYVRDYLRGNTEFVWNTMACEILVSEYDLEKNEFFKQEAANWRTLRKHNRGARVRVRRKKP